MPLPIDPKFNAKLLEITEKKIKKELGYKQNQNLPQSVQTVLKKAVTKSAGESLGAFIDKESLSVTKELLTKTQMEKWKDRVKHAHTGINEINNTDEVEEILKARAELLKKKINALESNKFSRDEAMKILLADIGVKG
jgi:DNA gyrase/topoisomerase IV subunit A